MARIMSGVTLPSLPRAIVGIITRHFGTCLPSSSTQPVYPTCHWSACTASRHLRSDLHVRRFEPARHQSRPETGRQQKRHVAPWTVRPARRWLLAVPRQSIFGLGHRQSKLRGAGPRERGSDGGGRSCRAGTPPADRRLNRSILAQLGAPEKCANWTSPSRTA